MTQYRSGSRGSFVWFAAALSFAAGCTGRTSDGRSAQGVVVVMKPDAATLYSEQSLAFDATVTGAANTAVTWSVEPAATGGSITPSGFYTAPSTAGVYRVVATSVAAPGVSGSATVTVEPAPPGGTPMTTAHRTNGVAPLAVFFDAVSTTPSGTASPFTWDSGVYQPTDYEGTDYLWNFGDPGSGTWATTGNSKNTATGYTAAHVYETPGTYTATLTITDSTGTVRTYSQQITVSAFSGATYYVAAPPTGNDANDGLSTASPFATPTQAMSTALATSGPVRVLFRRGDSWTTAGQWNITKAGPGIIGAYADGTVGHTTSDPRPVLTCSFDNGSGWNIFQPYGSGSDWRIMDLEMHPAVSSHSNTAGPVGPVVDKQGRDLLILRLKSVGWDVGIGWGDFTPIYATPHDGMFVVDNEVPPTALNVSIYVGGRRLAVMGNLAYDSPGTHIVRVWQGHKAVISNNILLRPGGQRHALKLHGPELNDGRPETRWVSVSDNVFQGSATSQWTVSIGSQSNASTENDPVSHVIFERNRFTASPTTVMDLESEARNTIIRNNVFDDTGSPACVSILYAQRNPYIPAPDDIRVYNNTTYKGSAATDVSGFLQTDSTATNLRVRNNFYGAASAANTQFIYGTGGTGWAADHNLLSTSPGFTDAAHGDFSELAGSPAVDAGVALQEVPRDLLGVSRPLGAAYDLGAFESH